MDLGSLSPKQLKELVCGIVDDRLRELLGDPDLGLQLGEALRTRLKASLANTDRFVRRRGRGQARTPLVGDMPWYRLSFQPAVVNDLASIEVPVAQRLFEKTKWIASNVDNLRHEPAAQDLPDLCKYAVGEWRIFYTLDRGERLVDIHAIIHRTSLSL